MTVNDLLKKGFSALTVTNGQREIKNVYIGDLLSWVMGKAKADDAWITIMSNINVVAVASLTDVAVIILAEDVVMADDVLNTAAEKGINVVSTGLNAYETALCLAEMLQ